MRRTNFVRPFVGLATVALLAATLAAPAFASGSVSVSGRPAWATGARFVRHAGRAERVDLAMVLGFRDQAGLDSLAAAVSNPRSPSYGHYLTPAQFHTRFARSASDVAAVVSWLRSQGLHVGSVPANHLLVYASGTVAQAEAAFGTTLNDYRVGSRTVRAPASSPTVPASLSGIVQGVVGLADTEAVPMAMEKPNAPPPYGFRVGKPCSAYWGEKTATNKPKAYGSHRPWAPCGYTPQQMQGAYGVDQVIASGIDGTGQTVAVIDAFHAPTMKFDLKKYSARHGLPVPVLIQRNATPRKGPHGGKRGWYGEETLDLEAVHSMAPNATLLFEGARNATDTSLLDRLTDVIDGHRASIITNSWDSNESAGGNIPAYEALFQQAAAEGIGVYFSSGDCGDEIDPDGLCGGEGSRSVDYPASSPNVTAVGGTSLAVGKSNDYLSETGWGTGVSFLSRGQQWKPKAPGLFLYGSGGGTSQLFDEPDYQKGVVPESLSGYWGGENRVVPDISADADPNTGFLIGETQYFHHQGYRYDEYRIGGTSLSSPLFAGMMALANQAAGHDLGFVNPALYQLAGSDSIRDITSPAKPVAVVRSNWVNNQSTSQGRSFSLRSMNDTGTLHTTPGYDDVTGLGTPFMTKLVQALR